MRHFASGIILGLTLLSALTPAIAAQDECSRRVNSDERLVPLRDKLPKVVTAPTMQQLADHSRPTKLQKKALIAYDEDRSICEEEFGTQLKGEASNAFSMFVANSKKLRARLYDGEIDFGTFVSTDSDNLQVFQNYLNSLKSRDDAQAAADLRAKEQRETAERIANEQLEQQQEQFEADQKRQKIQAISNALQQLGNSIRRPTPVVTNCSSSYNNTTCTTY